jgi:hypothetical protein
MAPGLIPAVGAPYRHCGSLPVHAHLSAAGLVPCARPWCPRGHAWCLRPRAIAGPRPQNDHQ